VSTVFGIDLGTTYSCIASVDSYGRPAVQINADSQPTTPSVVLFDSATDVVVGVQAKRNARVRPDDVVSLVKRHMDDPQWRFRAHGQDYSAPAISSQILRSLATDAGRVTGEKVTDVVITVPAYTGHEFREATRLAGRLAGLNVVDIINEPTAAAFAYGFAQEGSAAQTVLVYDLGGGTFDVTVIRLAERSIEVVATDGNHELGGADWDERLATHLSTKFVEQCPAAGDPLDDSYGAQDLITLAEEAKQSLSTRDSYDAMITHNGGRAVVGVSRAEYEALTSSLVERTLELTARVLETARSKGVETIDQVLLVGGMSKSPTVSRLLAERFGFSPTLADPDLAVAKGAAIYGQKKELEGYVLESLRRQGKLGDDQSLDSAAPVDLSKAVAETAQTYGLAESAVNDIVSTAVTNVTSRGFGVEVMDADTDELYVEFLAHAQDPLPISVEQRFFTMADNQTAVQVRVLEQNTPAESRRPDDNRVIVEGDIAGIPRGNPRGMAVDIIFEMGTDQVITVTARHAAVRTPLVLSVAVGAGSATMREEEKAKVDLLKQRD
jgi:molecular chaperone DnaK (HSP70)